eukprot:1577241-Rhodomonas_salina.1
MGGASRSGADCSLEPLPSGSASESAHAHVTSSAAICSEPILVHNKAGSANLKARSVIMLAWVVAGVLASQKSSSRARGRRARKGAL